MTDYISIIIADILLAGVFVFQKLYQKKEGSAPIAVLLYNALMGAVSAIIFLFINNFKISVTMYSVFMAAVFAIVGMLYIFLGFKLMEEASVSLYTLFLMTGGMTLPYLWGAFFLNEKLTVSRIIGLLVILIAIVIYNLGKNKIGKKQLLLCFAIFCLNGTASILSKMHQINPASEIVTATDFTFLVMMFKTVICLIALILLRKRVRFKANGEKIHLSVIHIIIFAAVADGISYMLQLIGAANLPATVLYPFVTGGSIVLSSVASAVILREKLTGKQYISVALCFVGTLLFL